MESQVFFLYLLVCLLTARVFAETALRLQAPPVLGELLAGIVLGPSLLGWIEPIEALKLLAEIGVILLLFKVGLETDVQRLVRSGSPAALVAFAGFLLPLMLGFALAYWGFELSWMVSLFVGGTITATSIGITVGVLADLKRLHAPEGQIVLGAAVLDDVLGVVLLALLYEFATRGGTSVSSAAQVTVFIGAFFLFAPVAAKTISLVIKHFDDSSEIPGLIPTTVVALVLFFAWLAHAVGAPELLGGFAAGLALSRRFFLPLGVALHADPVFAGRIEEQMKPIVHLFTPIFFVMVGLSLNLREVDWSSPFVWSFSLALLGVAVLGKLLGAFFLGESWATRLAIGVAMIPRGEVGLIFAELGRMSGMLMNEIYASLLIVIALTTLLSPLLLKQYYLRYGERMRGIEPAES